MYLIYAERILEDFIQVVHVPAYISTIMSAAADEGPDEMTCFPVGLHYILTFPTRMSKIIQKSVCLFANFSEKGCLHLSGDISPYKFELFQKGELWTV